MIFIYVIFLLVTQGAQRHLPKLARIVFITCTILFSNAVKNKLNKEKVLIFP